MAVITVVSHKNYNNSAKEDNYSGNQNINQTNKYNSSNSGECSLYVRAGMDKKVLVPDPATAEGKIVVSLKEESDIEEVRFDGTEENEAIFSNYLVDLSFAGFDKPVFASAYVVGNISGVSNMKTHISRRTENGVMEQEISGGCLGLFVTTGMDKFAKIEPDAIGSYNCYFVVLDYKNGVCYKEKTDFSLCCFDWVDLNLADLTGDGAQEMIVSYNYNKSIDFGVYHVNADKNNMEEIYSCYQDYEKNGDFIDRMAFEGRLQDNYKVVLGFPCTGYSKTVSMITDAGYSKSKMQKKMYGWGGINYVGMWNKGKLQKKWAKEHGKVFLYTLDDISCVKTKEGIMQLELVRSVCVGHRSEEIGTMHTYLGYNKDSGSLVVKNAEYADKKMAYKECHTKTWGKFTFK